MSDRKISQLQERLSLTGGEDILLAANGITYRIKAQVFAADLAGIVVDKDSVGLGNVDNTSDLDKPISNATQEAIDLKADTSEVILGLATKADSIHTHEISDVDGLSGALLGKAAAVHTHTIADVTGLEDTLNLKVEVATVDSMIDSAVLSKELVDVNQMDLALTGKADTIHGHIIGDITGLTTALEERPIESAVTLMINNRVSALNLVNETQLTQGLNTKANAVHGHQISDVQSLQLTLDSKANLSAVSSMVDSAIDSRELVSVSDLSGALLTKANAVHTHAMTDVIGLGDALDLKANSSDIEGLVETALQDLQVVSYNDLTMGLNTKANTVHTHEIADVNGLQDILNDKAGTDSITEAVEIVVENANLIDQDDLSNALSTKADAIHNHAMADVMGLTDALGNKADSSAIPGLVASALEEADVVSETQLNSGLSTKADTVHSHEMADVNGLSAALGNKADTSAIPGLVESAIENIGAITEAQLNSALSTKADTLHTHTIAQITELQDELNSKAGLVDLASKADASALADKANLVHSHAMSDVTGLTDALGLKANTADIPTQIQTEIMNQNLVSTSALSSILLSYKEKSSSRAIAPDKIDFSAHQSVIYTVDDDIEIEFETIGTTQFAEVTLILVGDDGIVTYPESVRWVEDDEPVLGEEMTVIRLTWMGTFCMGELVASFDPLPEPEPEP